MSGSALHETFVGLSQNILVRLLLPILLSVVLFLCTIFLLLLPRIEDEIFNGRREVIRGLSTTTAGLVSEYAQRAGDGTMSLEEAQTRAKERVRNLRYGPENLDYFWINDMHPRVIVHPYRPDLEGEDVTYFSDPAGKRFFRDFVQVAREHGEGYVEYLWQRYDDPTRVVPKLSFVKAVPEWGWVVGTGVYLDDAYAEIAVFTRRVVYICVAITGGIAGLLAFVVWQGIIIERRRMVAEQVMRESEAKYRTLVEMFPHGIAIMQDQKTAFVNRAMVQMLGYRCPEELIGQDGYANVAQEDRQRLGVYAQTRHLGVPSSPKHYEATFRKTDDTLFPVEVFVESIEFRGRPALQIISIDISERKRSEGELRRLTAIVESTSDLVSTALPNEQLTYLNQAGYRMLGWDDSVDIQTRAISSIHPAWAYDFIRNEAIPAAAREGVWEGETAILTAQGIEIPVSQTVMVHRTAVGTVEYYSTIMRDIKEQKNAQEELERHRAHLEELVRERTLELQAAQDELLRRERLATLGQLTATVSHELRNPLGTIRGSLHLLTEALRGREPTLDRVLERAERSILRCDHIIDELLSYTRSHHQSPESTALDEWLEDALKEISIPSEVHLVTHFGFGSAIDIDRQRLLQCLINVVNNACEAMVAGNSCHKKSPCSLEIVTDANGNRAEIRVIDTGPGIPEDELPKVFEPLFSRKSFGVGLGLAIVQQIMQEHNGGVEIASRIGEGTVVTLWLPLDRGKVATKQEDTGPSSELAPYT